MDKEASVNATKRSGDRRLQRVHLRSGRQEMFARSRRNFFASLEQGGGWVFEIGLRLSQPSWGLALG